MFVLGVALQTDGKILAAGGRSVIRLESNGNRDNTFNMVGS